MSTLLSLLHSMLRNFVIYFGPLVIIGSTLILNLPNPEIYKQSFKTNNLYGQLSDELSKLEPNKNTSGNILEQIGTATYDNFFWSTIGKNLASKEWLQNLTETNLDRLGIWLSGKEDNLNLFFPQDEVNQAVREEALKSAQQTNPQLKALQDTAGQAWNEFLNRGSQISQAAGNAFNDFCQKNPTQDICKPRPNNQGLNPAQQISDYTQNLTDFANPWFTPLKTLRNGFIYIQSLAWIVILTYAAALIFLALVSPWFAKTRIGEISAISLKLGLNTLAATLTILASLWAIFLSGVLIRQFLTPALQQPQILNILGWQGVWTSLAILAPALIGSIGLVIVGIICDQILRKSLPFNTKSSAVPTSNLQQNNYNQVNSQSDNSAYNHRPTDSFSDTNYTN